MLELAIKTVALFFLLQAAFVLIASVTTVLLSRFVPGNAKLRFALTLHVTAFASALSFSVAMAVLSKTGVIRMTTSYFMVLMTGPGEKGIIVAGWVGFILSLLTSYLFVRAGTPPNLGRSNYSRKYRELPVIETDKMEFSALFGIFKPVIVLSNRLDVDETDVALSHEYNHFLLKHNMIKLFFRFLLRLNMFNVPLQDIKRELGLLCEFECDHATAKETGGDKYICLMKKWKNEHTADQKSKISIDRRIGNLENSGVREISAVLLAVLFTAGLIPVLVPAVFLFLSGIPRCAVICFLGY